jgi:putative spermidine/putrescine transport system permease protein
MSAIEASTLATGSPVLAEPATPRRPRERPSIWRWAVLLVAAVFFATPMVASLEFSLRGDHGTYSFASYRHIVSEPGFGSSFSLSLELALLTVLITLALLIPTAVHVELRVPQLRHP